MHAQWAHADQSSSSTCVVCVVAGDRASWWVEQVDRSCRCGATYTTSDSDPADLLEEARAEHEACDMLASTSSAGRDAWNLGRPLPFRPLIHMHAVDAAVTGRHRE